MRTGALGRPGAEPGVWAAGGGGKGRPGPGSPEQQAGAERSRVLQPPRSREPGQPPPTAVMSAGPLLKGQAARRGSERGLGAAGRAWGYCRGAGGATGSPNIQLDRVPETQEPAETKRRQGSPREPTKLWGSVPSRHTDVGTPIQLACPGPGTTFSISLGGERPHLGEGSAAVSAGNCSPLGLLSTPPPRKWAKAKRPGGLVSPSTASVAGSQAHRLCLFVFSVVGSPRSLNGRVGWLSSLRTAPTPSQSGGAQCESVSLCLALGE